MGSDCPSSAAVLLQGASYKRVAVLGGKQMHRVGLAVVGLAWSGCIQHLTCSRGAFGPAQQL